MRGWNAPYFTNFSTIQHFCDYKLFCSKCPASKQSSLVNSTMFLNYGIHSVLNSIMISETGYFEFCSSNTLILYLLQLLTYWIHWWTFFISTQQYKLLSYVHEFQLACRHSSIKNYCCFIWHLEIFLITIECCYSIWSKKWTETKIFYILPATDHKYFPSLNY